MPSVKAVTLRYRPILPIEVYDGALAESYVLQTKVYTKLSDCSVPRFAASQNGPRFNTRSNETCSNVQQEDELDDYTFDDLLEADVELTSQELAQSTKTATKSEKFQVGDKVVFYADHSGGVPSLTLGIISQIYESDVSVQLLAQQDPSIMGPLFRHRGGMSLIISKKTIFPWDESDEITSLEPHQYLESIKQKKSSSPTNKISSANKRKELPRHSENSSPKKRAITPNNNQQDSASPIPLNITSNDSQNEWCPQGVIELDLSEGNSALFASRWQNASYIAVGCVFSQGVSNFRKLLFQKSTRSFITAQPKDCQFIGFGFYLDTEELYFLSSSIFTGRESQAMQLIVPLLQSTIPKVCYQLQFFLSTLFQNLWAMDDIHAVEDPYLLAWVANTERDLSFNQLLSDYLELPPTEEVFSSKELVERNSISIFYSDLQHCIALFQVIEASLDTHEIENYQSMEIPLVITIANIQQYGIFLDAKILKQNIHLVEEYLLALESAAQQVAGTKFNLSSTNEVGDVLFNQLQLPIEASSKKTKKPSTGKDVLMKLAQIHPLPALILDHRTTKSLLSASLLPLLKLSQEHQGRRIRCQWHVTHSPTGRVTTTEPNLQALPREKSEFSFPDGREFVVDVRGSVKAENGFSFLSFDYSQLELRVLAHFCQDASLVEYLESGQDIHSLIASRWLKKPLHLVTKEDRQHSKQISYGIIYGMSPKTLGEKIDCSMHEAASLIKTFNEVFPGINVFQNRAVEYCTEHGYIKTILGRRRHINLNATGTEKAAARRKILSSIIQGSASDIVNQAMISCYNALTKGFPPSTARFVLQIHDEFLIECPCDEIARVKEIVKKCMENSVSTSVSLPVQCKQGQTFGSLT